MTTRIRGSLTVVGKSGARLSNVDVDGDILVISEEEEENEELKEEEESEEGETSDHVTTALGLLIFVSMCLGFMLGALLV